MLVILLLKGIFGCTQRKTLISTFFLVFINNISRVFQHCNYLLFADDRKILLQIDVINGCLKSQNDLD